MRHLIAAAALVTLLAPATELPAQRGATQLVKAMDRWIKEYRQGKIDMRFWLDWKDQSVIQRYGLQPKIGAASGPVTPLRELQELLDHAVLDGSPEVALRVLRLAGSGLDPHRYSHGHATPTVRSMAERAVAQLRSPPVKRMVFEVAAGQSKEANSDKKTRDAARAAALRAVGVLGGSDAAPLLIANLREAQSFLRLAAADGLRRLRDVGTIDALIAVLQREEDESVLIAAAGALLDVFEAGGAEVPTKQMRTATRTVLAALGRRSWRVDLALLAFVEKHRTVEAVPALIEVLAQNHEHPEWMASGKISGTLQTRVHELLVGLTGALFPKDRPDEWRAFWEKEGNGFVVAAPVERSASPKTVSTGFFGIDIQGTRVVFIIDVSLSMIELYPVAGTSAGGRRARRASKLDVAKRELNAAIDGLPPEAQFNIVVFYDAVKTWKKTLQAATLANKKSAARYIKKLKGRPATNVWGGLQTGLSIRSLVYGARYDSTVDEIFVLSDGWPTSGEILDPGEILITINESNRFSKVRINTIFLGTAGDAALHANMGWQPEGWMRPEEMMEKLAAHNGGRYVQPK